MSISGIPGKTLAIRENTGIDGVANSIINISTGGTVQNVAYSASATDISTGTLDANRLPTQTTQLFNILGRTNGTAQTAGNIGQILNVTLLSTGIGVTIPNNITTNIISLVLTPGNWALFASAYVTNSTNSVDPITFSLNTVSATLDDSIYNAILEQTGNTNKLSAQLPVRFFNVSVNTTIFLICRATHTGIMTGYGKIDALRFM
jgi:hypothetical protein